VIFCRAI